jgi:hypothetical protein
MFQVAKARQQLSQSALSLLTLRSKKFPSSRGDAISLNALSKHFQCLVSHLAQSWLICHVMLLAGTV